MLSSTVVAPLSFLVLLIALVPERGADAADSMCNATNSTTNATLNLQYFASLGNVSSTMHFPNGTTESEVVGLSLCTPEAFYAHDGTSCGTALLARMSSTCDGSTLYDVQDTPLMLVNDSTAWLRLSASRPSPDPAHVTVIFHCMAGYDGLAAEWVSDTVLQLSGEMSCQGYKPTGSGGNDDDDNMLSKGSIVGIIIGVVAVVVISAAIVQWRTRTNSEDNYQAL